jgi:hypothetical protein
MAFLERFRSRQREVWEALSREVDGRYTAGTWRAPSKVQVEVGQWTLTLDTYTVHAGNTPIVYTRMRAPYVNADGFRFEIYRKGFFTDIAKKLGMQDVVVGHPAFDDGFVIKGTDEAKLRKLFANAKVRELIEAQPKVHLRVKDDEGWFRPKFPAGVDELEFAVAGVITDLPRLRKLYDLFAEVLEQLCEIGSAYRHDPHVER